MVTYQSILCESYLARSRHITWAKLHQYLCTLIPHLHHIWSARDQQSREVGPSRSVYACSTRQRVHLGLLQLVHRADPHNLPLWSILWSRPLVNKTLNSSGRLEALQEAHN